jgi:hypothetical protein
MTEAAFPALFGEAVPLLEKLVWPGLLWLLWNRSDFREFLQRIVTKGFEFRFPGGHLQVPKVEKESIAKRPLRFKDPEDPGRQPTLGNKSDTTAR